MEVKPGSKRTKILVKFKAKIKFLVCLKEFTILNQNNNENKINKKLLIKWKHRKTTWQNH